MKDRQLEIFMSSFLDKIDKLNTQVRQVKAYNKELKKQIEEQSNKNLTYDEFQKAFYCLPLDEKHKFINKNYNDLNTIQKQNKIIVNDVFRSVIRNIQETGEGLFVLTNGNRLAITKPKGRLEWICLKK